MNAKKVFKGASVLAGSQLLIAASTFIRNIIVARMISVENYGIATIFALTVSIVEMSGNMAFDRLLVQDKNGDSDEMLASAHFMQFLKSILLSSLLFALARPTALLFDLPDVAWAFEVLAIIPLIKGLTHFDRVVQQREMKFKATAVIDAVPHVLVCALAFPLAQWLEDYRVMLFIVIVQTLVSVVLSHFMARRPYRWAIRRDLVRKKLKFGWPLLINGLLMFAIFQGDKAIIGANYNMEILGWYAAAFALTLMPTLLFSKVVSLMLLPTLSKAQRDAKSFVKLGMTSAAVCALAAVFFGVFFIVGGPAFVTLAYGPKYAEAGAVISWLGLVQAMRIFRIAPTIMATAQADTINSMYANIVRTIALVLALAFAYQEMPVHWIAISGIVGELLALIMTLYLLKLPQSKPLYTKNAVALFLVGALYCAFSLAMVPDLVTVDIISTCMRLLEAVAVSGILAITVLLLDRNSRLFVMRIYRGA